MRESLIMLINVPELADKQLTSVKMYECCRQLNGVNLARCFAMCVRVCVHAGAQGKPAALRSGQKETTSTLT